MNRSLGLVLLVAAVYTLLTLWSVIQLGSYRGSSGCDGGLCGIFLLFAPVVALGYLLLLPAAFWLTQSRSWAVGVGAVLTTLAGLLVSIWLRAGLGDVDTAVDEVLSTCACLTLGMQGIRFLHLATARTKPESDPLGSAFESTKETPAEAQKSLLWRIIDWINGEA